MGGHKQKFEVLVPKGELGTFFSNLGAGLQCGQLNFGGGQQAAPAGVAPVNQGPVELGVYESFKLSIKDRGEAVIVKAKIKYPKFMPAAAAPQGEAPAADAEGE